jgi:hypothetical protein
MPNKKAFLRAEERLLKIIFGNPAIHEGPVALRPRIAPGLLLSENLFGYIYHF